MWVIVPLVIVLLSWHPLALQPKPGADISWEAALQMAHHYGIGFGNHLVFTYGPLGFLTVPTLWYGGTGTIAFIYAVLVRVALVAALFAAARRSYGVVVGAIAALLVADACGVLFVTIPFLHETVPFFVFSVWVVDRVSSQSRLLMLMAAGGALAGLELLNKVSVGIEMTALAVIMAIAARGRRRDHLVVVLAALIVTLLAAWTVAGQDLGALPAYARNSEQIVSGYAAGQGYEEAGFFWQIIVGWVAFAFGIVGALHMTADDGVRRRWGVIALWVVFCFFEFKEGFVRHDGPQHGTVALIELMAGFLALRWRPGGRLVGLGLAAILFAVAVAAQESPFSRLFDPVENASSAISQTAQVFSASERDATIATGRELIQATLPIDSRTLELLQGHTVYVAPYDQQVIWAYRLDWRPLPVFESYTAYTTRLDLLNANALDSAEAPQRILRDPLRAIDNRVGAFDEGLTTRTILCHYQELRTTESWQVLGLGPNRCRAPVPLSTVHADWDQNVPVPPPPNNHSFVFVRIKGVAVGGLERLSALLFRPTERLVLLDGITHRLVEGTATDGLPLRAPPEVDFSPPFNIAPNTSEIAVLKAGQGMSGGLPITFSFYSESVDAGPRSTPVHRAIIGNHLTPSS